MFLVRFLHLIKLTNMKHGKSQQMSVPVIRTGNKINGGFGKEGATKGDNLSAVTTSTTLPITRKGTRQARVQKIKF